MQYKNISGIEQNFILSTQPESSDPDSNFCCVRFIDRQPSGSPNGSLNDDISSQRTTSIQGTQKLVRYNGGSLYPNVY